MIIIIVVIVIILILLLLAMILTIVIVISTTAVIAVAYIDHNTMRLLCARQTCDERASSRLHDKRTLCQGIR